MVGLKNRNKKRPAPKPAFLFGLVAGFCIEGMIKTVIKVVQNAGSGY